MHLIVPSSCLRSVWHFAENAFHRRVPRVSRASGIFREMPLIFLSSCLRGVWHFAWNAFYPRVWMFQERPAFCGKCLWSSCAISQERLAFYGKCLSSSCVHPWGVSGILSKCRLSGNTFYRRAPSVARASGISWELPLIVECACFRSGSILREMPIIFVCSALRGV